MALNRRLALQLLVATMLLVAGIAIGLTIGWIVAPVEWQGPPPATMVVITADLFAFDRNQARARSALGSWPSKPHVCAAFASATEDGLRQRLAMLLLIMEVRCE